MAFLQVNFYSETLKRKITANVIIPNDMKTVKILGNPNYERPLKTLYLLHGYELDSFSWLLSSRVNDYAEQYNMAIIMPDGQNGFYVDKSYNGGKYSKFIGEELVRYISGMLSLSDKPEDTFIGGFSMGGYGAVLNGVKYPDKFGKIMGLSNALILHDLESRAQSVTRIAEESYFEEIFGDLDDVKGGMNDPEFLIDEILKRGGKIQPMYLACGTEDALLENNRSFRDFLRDRNCPLTYVEDQGDHNYEFWDKYLKNGIQWLLNE